MRTTELFRKVTLFLHEETEKQNKLSPCKEQRVQQSNRHYGQNPSARPSHGPHIIPQKKKSISCGILTKRLKPLIAVPLLHWFYFFLILTQLYTGVLLTLGFIANNTTCPGFCSQCNIKAFLLLSLSFLSSFVNLLLTLVFKLY